MSKKTFGLEADKEYKRDETVYVKRRRGYVPIGKRDFETPYVVGDYLVKVRRNSRGIRYLKIGLPLDEVALFNVLVEAQEALAGGISKWHSFQPKSTQLTKKEKRAWDRYIKDGGFSQLSMKSYFEIAQLTIDELREKISERMEISVPEGCMKIWDSVEL